MVYTFTGAICVEKNPMNLVQLVPLVRTHVTMDYAVSYKHIYVHVYVIKYINLIRFGINIR